MFYIHNLQASLSYFIEITYIDNLKMRLDLLFTFSDSFFRRQTRYIFKELPGNFVFLSLQFLIHVAENMTFYRSCKTLRFCYVCVKCILNTVLWLRYIHQLISIRLFGTKMRIITYIGVVLCHKHASQKLKTILKLGILALTCAHVTGRIKILSTHFYWSYKIVVLLEIHHGLESWMDINRGNPEDSLNALKFKFYSYTILGLRFLFFVCKSLGVVGILFVPVAKARSCLSYRYNYIIQNSILIRTASDLKIRFYLKQRSVCYTCWIYHCVYRYVRFMRTGDRML